MTGQARILSAAEFESALDSIRHRRTDQATRPMHEAVLLLAFKGGLRIGEIAQLEWRHVQNAKGAIADAVTIPAAVTKGGRINRTVPLHADTIDALTRWRAVTRWNCAEDFIFRRRDGSPAKPNTLAVWWREFFKRQGLEGVSSHSGRRSFATVTARKIQAAGGSLRDVQQMLGHSDLSTTAVYLEPNEEAQRKVIDKL
jgi:integrase